MSIYRPIYKRIWKDPDFQELDAHGKLIFIYLCTNEATNESGIYPITFKTIANETSIPLPTVTQQLSNGYLKNVSYDHDRFIVFVKRLRRYNTGGKPELIEKSIKREMETTPHPFWNEFFELYPNFQPLANSCITVVQPPDTIRYDTIIDKDIKNIDNQDINIEGLDNKTWLAYLEMRKKKKSYPTDHAIGLIVKKLDEFKSQGQDINKILEQSIMYGWVGLFPLKQNNGEGAETLLKTNYKKMVVN